MTVAALLLTGGASRRMGRDKARLRVPPDVIGEATETLATRTARLLSAVAEPVLEVGGDATGLTTVADRLPFGGPLVALAGGVTALRDLGCEGSVLVLATDLPRLTPGLLRWLADHPSGAAVVPVDRHGRPQPLCARYPLSALDQAGALVASGAQSLQALLETIDLELVAARVWVTAAGRPDALDDVDRPEDLPSAWPSMRPSEQPSERSSMRR